jgi:hypothetical protein
MLWLAALALVGCASASTGSASQTQGSTRDMNVISAQELATALDADLYTAIQRLRPAFFQTRGASSLGVNTAPEAIQVYVDDTKSGDINSLRQIRPNEVLEVRRLSASEATQRFGTGHTMGAIIVKRR